VKDIRVGESLWSQWQGDGYESETDAEVIYFTHDHVDTDNELVRRALASTLQRDGVADSLADGFKMIESAYIAVGWAGIIIDESEYWACDENGENEYGDSVENSFPVTWIEI
jgi:ABC-type transport system substrate-binding protein